MRFATAASLCLLLASSPASGAERDRPDFSPAERLLFMTPQLRTLQAPTQLRYTFSKTGSLEEAFTDRVAVALSARPEGGCCDAKGAFLSGARKLQVPDVPAAEANPVILYFLEHDVREMKRLTGGSENHFRKRLRMAIYQSAEVRDATMRYRGRAVSGKEIVFSPFLDDPNRPRYEKFSNKSYHFLLSAAVPGGVYGIRTRIQGEGPIAEPLLVEELLIDGAQAPAR
ncbi:hypothetical protein H6CHR_03549 [Variovorax sp. PBL-H6]|uniref:hypothetical protein n=1 Tax=Variovorax sp. PBL-H6 TaxID=434009 RepID=UPI0013198963|nr:hypothetical protein [Variovorax sp. PBL-H6]VTU31190.1 hypothetical protein H6CHR_03549 [Variovorax sp. PBL-H6]